jgi:large subunit ribosomal protein L10
MNREQKSAAIAEIAESIEESGAVFAVDYRGISVSQVAELRDRLRDADASFKVVKNSLTERAADQVGAETLKEYLIGPTALTFVRGDVALAAKAVAEYGRTTQLLPFKGGLMDGAPIDVEQIRALSRLPARDVLYGQLVGIVASPVSGLVRTLNALLGGLAVALGQVREKKESGEIPAGEPPHGEAPAATEAPAEAAEADAPEAEAPEQAPEADAPAEAEAAAPATEAEAPADAETEAEAPAATEAAGEPATDQAEPEAEATAQEDNQAEASADDQPADAEANPTKED